MRIMVLMLTVLLSNFAKAGDALILDKAGLQSAISNTVNELKLRNARDLSEGTNRILTSESFLRIWNKDIWTAKDLIDISLSSKNETELAVAAFLAHSMARRDWISWFTTVVGKHDSIIRTRADLLAIALCPGNIYSSINRFAHIPEIKRILLGIIESETRKRKLGKDTGNLLDMEILKLVDDAMYFD